MLETAAKFNLECALKCAVQIKTEEFQKLNTLISQDNSFIHHDRLQWNLKIEDVLEQI